MKQHVHFLCKWIYQKQCFHSRGSSFLTCCCSASWCLSFFHAAPPGTSETYNLGPFLVFKWHLKWYLKFIPKIDSILPSSNGILDVLGDLLGQIRADSGRFGQIRAGPFWTSELCSRPDPPFVGPTCLQSVPKGPPKHPKSCPGRPTMTPQNFAG